MDSVPHSDEEGKVCKKCGEWKPITKFHVHKTSKGGRKPICGPCSRPITDRSAAQRAWREKNKDRRKAYREAHAEENREKRRVRDQKNKEKLAAYARAYHLANLEKRRQQGRESYHRDPERSKEKQKRNLESRKARMGEAYYEASRERSRIWVRTHPEENRANANNAYARRKHQSVGKWTADEFKALCDHYGNVCLRCGAAKRLHADHVIPLSKGGRNDVGNLQNLCHSCNSRKHVDETDYRPDLGAYARSLVTKREEEA